MRRIVDNKMYDTDTATLLYYDADTKRCFYQTQNGTFFTLYPNGEIVPRAEKYAKQYLGERDVDMYIEIFGNVEEA